MWQLETIIPGEGRGVSTYRNKKAALRDATKLWALMPEDGNLDAPSPTPDRLLHNGAVAMEFDQLWIAILLANS